MHAARRLKSLFDQYPRIGSALTGLSTFGLGDVIAQCLRKESGEAARDASDGADSIKLHQSAQVAALGFVSNGLVLPSWYAFLDRTLGSSMTNRRTVLLKVAADQFVYAPFMISSYFSYFCLLRCTSFDEFRSSASSKIQSSLFTTWLADCAIWPAANAINFRFIPLIFRPVWTSVVQLIWQTYMAYVSSPRTNRIEESPSPREAVRSTP